MTRLEFDRWLKHHMSRFTGIAGWLAKFPLEARSEADVTRSSIRDAWEGVLCRVALEDALAATDALFGGDEPLPKIFDEHPQAVAKLARRLHKPAPTRVAYAAGEPTYRCGDCQDTGRVHCVHSETVKRLRQGRLALVDNGRGNLCVRSGWYEMSVACHCSAGDDTWIAREIAHVPRYSPLRYCRITRIRTDDKFAELQEWLANENKNAMADAAWAP